MTCEEFAKAVVDGLTERFGKGYSVEFFVPDGDKDGIISVYRDDRDVSVADGVLPYFEMYKSGTSVDSILDKLEESFRAELS